MNLHKTRRNYYDLNNRSEEFRRQKVRRGEMEGNNENAKIKRLTVCGL